MTLISHLCCNKRKFFLIGHLRDVKGICEITVEWISCMDYIAIILNVYPANSFWMTDMRKNNLQFSGEKMNKERIKKKKTVNYIIDFLLYAQC